MRKLKFWKRLKPSVVPSVRSWSSWVFPRAHTTAEEPDRIKGGLRTVDIQALDYRTPAQVFEEGRNRIRQLVVSLTPDLVQA